MQVVEACVIDTTVAPVETVKTTEAATTTTTITTTTTTNPLLSDEKETSAEISSKEIIKTYEEIAKEVWEGKWGNGPERRQRLEKAGYDYNKVQEKVVELVEEYKPSIENSEESFSTGNETYVKRFTRGTYYCYGCAKNGGSGRALIEGNTSNYIKGSIASSYLYNAYGYYYSGGRTMVRLEVDGYPSMNGYYYLDDCDAGNPNVIDFYYVYASNCPFMNQGVVQVDCWIVN